MIGKYLFASPAPGSEWISIGRLLLPFVGVSVLGGALTYLIRWLGRLPDVTSITPISIMLGVLSYTVIFAIDPMIAGNFTPLAIWYGIVLGVVVTWPIAFVMGPVFFIYMARLKKGRKVLKDSTVFYLSVLCLVSEAVFFVWFFNDA
jgi:hypothetical protein